MAPRPPKGAPLTSDAASDRHSQDEEFPPRSTEKEDKELADAVARGKTVLWPVAFLSTLGIGVGCSAGGIVKTRGWSKSGCPGGLCCPELSQNRHAANRFYFQVFIATLIGWLVLLVVQVRGEKAQRILRSGCEKLTTAHPSSPS